MPYRNPIHIFTDLDGTLLNHHDYRYEAALPLIRDLTDAGTGISLATSKTLPEVLAWQARLGLDSPFLVENGAAVYFPTPAFSETDLNGLNGMTAPPFTRTEAGLRVVLGAERCMLEDVLAPFREGVTSLAHCTRDEAVRLTGLTTAEAAMAQQRQHTLPLVITDRDPAGTEAAIRDAAATAGLQLVRGGRFLHLQGETDKGRALELIQAVLQRKTGTRYRTLALGDSDNDLPMLLAADIAVVVRTPAGHRLRITEPGTICTDQEAPEGWCEGVRLALQALECG